MRVDFTDPEFKTKSTFFGKKNSLLKKKSNNILPKNHSVKNDIEIKRDRFQKLLNKKSKRDPKKGISFSLNIFKKDKKEQKSSKINKLNTILKDKFAKKNKESNFKEAPNKKAQEIEEKLSNIFLQLQNNIKTEPKKKVEEKNVIKDKFAKDTQDTEKKLREIFSRLEENRRKYEEKKGAKRLTEEQSEQFLKIFEDIQKRNQNRLEDDKTEIKKKSIDDSSSIEEDEILKNFLNQKTKSSQKSSILKVSKSVKKGLNSYKSFTILAKTKEFFSVWLVNILFTLVSFGAYYPFAKQKIKEYLYNNTTLNGSNFEYKLNIKYLLDTSIFLAIISISSLALYYFNMPLMYQMAPILLAIVAMPWIIYKNIKSNIDALSYRNVYFKYVGKNLKSFYQLTLIYFGVIFAPTIALISASIYFYNNLAYALSAIFAIASIIYFLLSFTFLSIKLYNRYQDLIINKTYFGVNRFYFDTSVNSNPIFKKFLPIAIATTLIVGALSFLVYTNFIGQFTIDASIKYILIALVLFIGGNFFLGTLQGYLQNFTLNNTTLKGYSLKSNIKPIKLGAIKLVNSILQIFTLGLAYPYTKLKELKYRLSHTLFECDNYDEFIEGSI